MAKAGTDEQVRPREYGARLLLLLAVATATAAAVAVSQALPIDPPATGHGDDR